MKSRLTLYGAILTLAAVGVLAGCSRGRSDAEIAGDVQQKIGSDSSLPNKQITVSSNNGIVTLSGQVGSEAERQAAASDASQVKGVKMVVNNLEAAPAPVVAQQAAPEPPAAATPPAVKRTLKRSPRHVRTYSDDSAGPNSTASSGAALQQASAPEPMPVTVPEGTSLSVRMIDAVDSDRSQIGDVFHATLDSPISIDGKIAIPADADIEGRVAESKSAGHISGRSEIALELTRLSYNGKSYQLSTDQYTKEGTSRGKRSAATIGGGAALGAIIGGLAGGGKGAAIGAAAGAGAGTGVQAVTKGQQIHVKPETLLTFRLQSPLTVMPSSTSRNAERTKIN